MDVHDLPDFSLLAEPETTDPAAFLSSDEKEQEVCNFVLALAVVYNDFKDLLWAWKNWKDCEPPAMTRPDPQVGQYSGMKLHITRLTFSLFWELCELIRERTACQDHPLFKKTLTAVKPENLAHWNSLVTFTQGKSTQDELAKLLAISRNKLSFHYSDLKFMGLGYAKFFATRTGVGQDAAYASRGRSLAATRYYFADAALLGAFQHLEADAKTKVADRLEGMGGSVNRALSDIIECFVQVRGFAWKK